MNTLLIVVCFLKVSQFHSERGKGGKGIRWAFSVVVGIIFRLFAEPGMDGNVAGKKHFSRKCGQISDG